MEKGDWLVWGGEGGDMVCLYIHPSRVEYPVLLASQSLVSGFPARQVAIFLQYIYGVSTGDMLPQPTNVRYLS